MVWIEASRDPCRSHRSGVVPQQLRITDRRERVVISDEVQRFVLPGEFQRRLDGANIVTEMRLACWLDSGQRHLSWRHGYQPRISVYLHRDRGYDGHREGADARRHDR